MKVRTPGGPDRVFRGTSVRIGIQTALVVVGVVVVFAGLIYSIYVRDLDQAERQSLATTTARVDEPDEAAPGIMVTVLGPDGMTSSRDLPADLPDWAALRQVARTGVTSVDRYVHDHHVYLVRTAKVGDRVVQASIDQHDREEQRQRVLSALLVAGVVAVLLAAGLSLWLARRAVRPIEAALEMQRRFVADASHELRTPLTHLSTRVQMLGRRTNALAPEDLLPVVADTKRLAEILDDLLAASDTRQQPREPVDVVALVRSCAVAAGPYAAMRGVSIRVAVAEVTAQSGTVDGVPTALRRAITALVDNAIDHAGSEVVLTVAATRRYVELVVADDGPGISPEAMPRIFERFGGTRREDRSDAKGRRHYGIGLALVAEVAAAHGGDVTVLERGPGQGTAFRLRIVP